MQAFFLLLVIFQKKHCLNKNVVIVVKERQVSQHSNVANFNCDVTIEKLKNYMPVKSIKVCNLA